MMDITQALAILESALVLTKTVSTGETSDTVGVILALEQIASAVALAYVAEAGKPLDLDSLHTEDHV